jgi:hypothetical protein
MNPPFEAAALLDLHQLAAYQSPSFEFSINLRTCWFRENVAI